MKYCVIINTSASRKAKREGIGYTLDWSDEQLTEVSEWEQASFVEEDDVSYGIYMRGEVIKPIIGEIWDDGNTIYMISYYDGLSTLRINISGTSKEVPLLRILCGWLN